MTSLFDTIVYGPFEAEYHRDLVDDQFKAALRDFLSQHLLPQVDHTILSTEGTLRARANADRFCGPHSAVRNCFFLDFKFRGVDGDSDVSEQLWFQPIIGEFEVAMGRPLYLWTPERKIERESKRRKHEEDTMTVRSAMRLLTADSVHRSICPLCDTKLTVTGGDGVFGVCCPRGCFKYDFSISNGKQNDFRLKMGM